MGGNLNNQGKNSEICEMEIREVRNWKRPVVFKSEGSSQSGELIKIDKPRKTIRRRGEKDC